MVNDGQFSFPEHLTVFFSVTVFPHLCLVFYIGLANSSPNFSIMFLNLFSRHQDASHILSTPPYKGNHFLGLWHASRAQRSRWEFPPSASRNFLCLSQVGSPICSIAGSFLSWFTPSFQWTIFSSCFPKTCCVWNALFYPHKSLKEYTVLVLKSCSSMLSKVLPQLSSSSQCWY